MTSTASRVLPTPPGPVTVSKRTSASCSPADSAANSVSRPMSRVSGTGKKTREAGAATGAPFPRRAGRAAAEQRLPVGLREGEGIRQHPHGFESGSVTGTTLQVTDAVPAEPGTLSQVLLGQRRGAAQPAQQITE